MFCCFGQKRKKQKPDENNTQKETMIASRESQKAVIPESSPQKLQKNQSNQRQSIDDSALITHKNVYIVNESEELHLRVKNPSSKLLMRKAVESVEIEYIPDSNHRAS